MAAMETIKVMLVLLAFTLAVAALVLPSTPADPVDPYVEARRLERPGCVTRFLPIPWPSPSQGQAVAECKE